MSLRPMSLPQNVIWFEVFMYSSLAIDSLLVAFQDRTPGPDTTQAVISTAAIMAAGLILLMVYLVWLAAQRRKNWPRWILIGSLVLSIYSLADVISDAGIAFDSFIEIISCALNAAGLYYSYTGDAKGWFNA
jgi:cell division protein FtsW (lipid II flippase)